MSKLLFPFMAGTLGSSLLGIDPYFPHTSDDSGLLHRKYRNKESIEQGKKAWERQIRRRKLKERNLLKSTINNPCHKS